MWGFLFSRNTTICTIRDSVNSNEGSQSKVSGRISQFPKQGLHRRHDFFSLKLIGRPVSSLTSKWNWEILNKFNFFFKFGDKTIRLTNIFRSNACLIHYLHLEIPVFWDFSGLFDAPMCGMYAAVLHCQYFAHYSLCSVSLRSYVWVDSLVIGWSSIIKC